MRGVTIIFTVATLSQIALLEALAAPPAGHGPPKEAIDACEGASQGAACGFVGAHGSIEGTCAQPPGAEVLACVPAGPPPPPPAAIDACAGASAGASCSFAGPRGSVEGTCVAPPQGAGLVCALE